MNPIAKRIQEARIKAKLSEKELAKKCGLAASYIMQIESGKKIINENTADTILAVFGESMETSYSAYLEEEERKPAPAVLSKAPQKAPAPVKVAAPESVNVEPNAQWSGALANIIKQFQIIDIQSGKSVGQKELPVLNRKIEDIPWEKLLFFKASDEEASGLRIRKGDILWIQDTQVFQKEGIYLIQRQNRKELCRIQRQGNQLVLSNSAPGSKSVAVDTKDIRIIGRCIKAEFVL